MQAGFRRSLVAAFLVLFLLALICDAGRTQAQDLVLRPFDRDGILAMELPLQTSGIELNQALREIGRVSGVPVIAAQGLRGTVALRDSGATLGEALDEVAAQSDTVWWYDGAALRFEDRAGMTSRLIALPGVPGDLVLRQVAALGLEDPRYPVRLAEGGEFLRVVGPAGYGEAVAELVTLIAAQIGQRHKAVQGALRAANDPGAAEVDLTGLPVIIHGLRLGRLTQ